jgi:hypothetical protein
VAVTARGVRACSIIACTLLVLAAAVTALLLYAWLVPWLEKELSLASNMTEWLLRDASERVIAGAAARAR